MHLFIAIDILISSDIVSNSIDQKHMSVTLMPMSPQP